MPRNPTLPFEDDVIDRLARIEEQGATATSVFLDHESRLRGVEHKQWIFAGIAAGLAPLLSKLGFHFPTL